MKITENLYVDRGIPFPFVSGITRCPGLVLNIWLCLFMFKYGDL